MSILAPWGGCVTGPTWGRDVDEMLDVPDIATTAREGNSDIGYVS
jgi:hypothetical protein